MCLWGKHEREGGRKGGTDGRTDGENEGGREGEYYIGTKDRDIYTHTHAHSQTHTHTHTHARGRDKREREHAHELESVCVSETVSVCERRVVCVGNISRTLHVPTHTNEKKKILPNYCVCCACVRESVCVCVLVCVYTYTHRYMNACIPVLFRSLPLSPPPTHPLPGPQSLPNTHEQES